MYALATFVLAKFTLTNLALAKSMLDKFTLTNFALAI